MRGREREGEERERKGVEEKEGRSDVGQLTLM